MVYLWVYRFLLWTWKFDLTNSWVMKYTWKRSRRLGLVQKDVFNTKFIKTFRLLEYLRDRMTYTYQQNNFSVIGILNYFWTIMNSLFTPAFEMKWLYRSNVFKSSVSPGLTLSFIRFPCWYLPILNDECRGTLLSTLLTTLLNFE